MFDIIFYLQSPITVEHTRTTRCLAPSNLPGRVLCAGRMTILASREHTCIHPEVSRAANKNDGCRDLRDPHNQVSRPRSCTGHLYRQGR